MTEHSAAPPALRPGDLIAAAAPAGAVKKRDFFKGVELIASLGYCVTWREDIFSRWGYLAGSDERRAEELNGYLGDPEVRAILFARGGYGSSRLEGRLKLGPLCRRPKIIAGYSDISALLLKISLETGMNVFHGPFVTDTPRDVRRLMKFLGVDAGHASMGGLVPLREGRAQAPVTGGNLTMLAHSIGTPFEVRTEGRILFVEEVNEAPYRIDRHVRQLLLAGKLKRIRGLLLGSFHGCGRGASRQAGEIFLDALGRAKIPVAAGFPAGHGSGNRPFPMGSRATFDGAAGTISFAPALARS